METLKEGRGVPQRSGPSPSYDADSKGFQERLLTCMGNSVPGHKQMRREKPSFREAPINLLYKHSPPQESGPDPTLVTALLPSLFSRSAATAHFPPQLHASSLFPLFNSVPCPHPSFHSGLVCWLGTGGVCAFMNQVRNLSSHFLTET